MSSNLIDFASEWGAKIPDSFKTNNNPNEGWTTIPSPNFSNSSADVDLFQNSNSDNSSQYSDSDLFSQSGEQDLFSGDSSLSSYTSGMSYNSLSGIALGTLNSGIGNSMISEEQSEANHGQGPMGSAYQAIPTAEHTASNQSTAVSVASGAMSLGGLLGPEGLAAGAAVGLGIDALTASGAFDASPTEMMSTTGNTV